MASNMVSEETRENALDIPNTTDAKYSNPLLARAPLKADARFPFVLWRPRDGRNQAYALWIINLQQLLKALAPTFSQRRARCLQVQRDRLASSLRTRSMCLVRQSSPRRASETSENQKDRSISEDQSWSLGDRDLQ